MAENNLDKNDRMLVLIHQKTGQMLTYEVWVRWCKRLGIPCTNLMKNSKKDYPNKDKDSHQNLY